MVALFVVLTIVVLLGIELIVGRFEGRRFTVARESTPLAFAFATQPIPDGTHFHRGHAWARVGSDGLVTVGADEFTRVMAGRPDEIALPRIGEHVTQGIEAWKVRRGDRTIPMLAPISGEVVAVNESAMKNPSEASDDPYQAGWLLKVKPQDLRASLANLFDVRLARRWLEESIERLGRFFSPELGAVMQDGGTVSEGVIDLIEPDRLPDALREFFLAESPSVAH